MLSTAFNALTRLHSRPGMLKRLGTPDIFSLCRLMPANYFRFLRGPEYTTVKGVEFVIPSATMSGHLAQRLQFSAVPTSGHFSIGFGVTNTTNLNFNATALDIQNAIRQLAGLSNVLVTGDFTAGFLITFVGASSPNSLGYINSSTLPGGISNSWTRANVFWEKPLLKGDRIQDGANLWTIDEIIEMYDIGAVVMGYRVRAD